jgi:hypothetical protein
MGSKIVYTIGYGGWRLVDFVGVLKGLGVEVVVDVRRWTRSRRLPEYSSESLARALREAGLDYVWIPELGGYRRFGVDVEDYGVARCFESEGFRAYATYITRRGDVKPHLERLVEIASSRVAAVMCRERVPWLCHRKILSDNSDDPSRLGNGPPVERHDPATGGQDLCSARCNSILLHAGLWIRSVQTHPRQEHVYTDTWFNGFALRVVRDGASLLNPGV